MRTPSKDYVYMYVSDDEYELPLAVADSSKELAEILGIKKNTVEVMLCRKNKQYKKVCVADYAMA